MIGGFAVIAHDYVRATEDVDLLIPEDPENDERCAAALAALGAVWASDGWALGDRSLVGRAHSRLLTGRGLVDLLASLVRRKRLAGRPRDRLDIEELEARHGELPDDDLLQ